MSLNLFEDPLKETEMISFDFEDELRRIEERTKLATQTDDNGI